jgi:plastocyanin
MNPRTSVFIALVLASAPSFAAEPGSVGGTVVVRVEGVRLADVGPLVVFLDGVAGALEYHVPSQVVRISQKNAKFSPSFLVVARGQTVEMPNDDTIFHNVFSYSKPNEMELGLYPKGESRSVVFPHAGVVRVYCSIHESMSATIFVAPSPYHALADASGGFEIRAVPPGRYRLRTWNQMLPEGSGEVEVISARETRVQVPIEDRTPAK